MHISLQAIFCILTVTQEHLPHFMSLSDEWHIDQLHPTGESLDVKVLREGQLLDLEFKLKQRRPLVPILHGVDCVPSYFIVGGLVFVPLSIPFLEHAYGGMHYCFCPATRPLLSHLGFVSLHIALLCLQQQAIRGVLDADMSAYT